ncbi:MAG TPA: peptidoglycan-binding domain-containing protein [Pseudolabrys sp.]|nr:peptidoglycan-binding domain-containing protein [Pseudolabrys sp.]
MHPFLRNVRFGTAVLAVATMFAGALPSVGALAQAAPPATTATALSESTVKALQEALIKQGIAVKADGVLSDETRNAIRKYQSQHHLPVTGEPDKATLDKLGVKSRQSAVPDSGVPQDQGQAQTTGQAPSGLSGAGETQMQPGAKQGGMMMSGPMIHGSTREPAQASMQGMKQMMQGHMQSGQMQPGSTRPGPAQGDMTMSGPIMHGSTREPARASMQGMMQMMEGQMQPGRMQPGSVRPGPAQGDMMTNCPMIQESSREPTQASMQGMMQMMQGMMQMMEGQMQPGRMQPGPMRPDAR